jgi:uncharacterized protein DUF4112
MILNLAISTTLGIVPGLGAILIAAYHANVRNARLLENFLAARGERVGKAAQSANSDETKKDVATATDDKDRDRDDDEPQGKAGEMSMSEQKPGAARWTPDGEKEKEKSGTTDEDEKDKNTTTAPPEADSAEGDQPRLQYLRPPRNAAEYVHHRDSRFIEDVS